MEPVDIAIVGMAGLFAKAPTIHHFWENILNKVEAIDDPLPDWEAERFYDPHAPHNGNLYKLYTKRGGFLRELSQFDPKRHGIMPVAVAGGEPDQFHALDLAIGALEDAGYGQGKHDPERTGIILGHATHPSRANTNGIQQCVVVDQTVSLLEQFFPHLTLEEKAALAKTLSATLPGMTVDTAPGLVPNVMTGRIANRLNLMGSNYILDAACASSLVAVELAMLELQRHRADLMLAGGVNTSNSPLVLILFSLLGALSHRGHVRPFDASGDGTLIGEGGGILALKRLPEALRDGDRVYAVIKAVGQSSDGKGGGIMAPRLEGEVLAMRRAYTESGIDPATIDLVEAHGTAIPLGDRTEIQALTTLFGKRSHKLPHVALGSVKSMIGHCIPASGAAAFIKSALALYHQVLPPTLCEEVNPALELEKTPFYVNTEARPWIKGRGARRAAINAFGFGGINSHALLEESPGNRRDPLAAFSFRLSQDPVLITLAQESRSALIHAIETLKQDLTSTQDLFSLAKKWQSSTGSVRLAIVADHPQDLLQKLDTVQARIKEPDRHLFQSRNGIFFTDQPMEGKIALLFPGESAQYTDMLKELALRSPPFRYWFDFLDQLFAGQREVSPSQAIFPIATGLTSGERQTLKAMLEDIELGSESVFSADQGLFALFSLLGIRADFFLGHSTGENAALVAAKWLQASHQQIGETIYQMNQIFQGLEKSDAIPYGELLTIGNLSRDEAQSILEKYPSVYVTMDNCHNQFIIFGPPDKIAEVAGQLKALGAIVATLPLSRAYHTPYLTRMANRFRDLIANIPLRSTRSATLYSCATAQPFPQDKSAFLQTYAAQYTQTVLFRQAILNLYESSARIFIEIGPSGHLTNFVRDVLKEKSHIAVALHDKKQHDLTGLLHALGKLFIYGVHPDLSPLYRLPTPIARTEAPYLPNHLAIVHLQKDQADEVREMLLRVPSVPPDFQQSTQSQGVQANQKPSLSSPPQYDYSKSPQKLLEIHFTLMQDFIQQQERVMLARMQTVRQRKKL